MENLYPFKNACEILYENPHFLVAFGWDEQNDRYSVGLRWGNSANPYPIGQHGVPQWFILYEALSIDFLHSLKKQDNANHKAIDEAIEKLQTSIKE